MTGEHSDEWDPNDFGITGRWADRIRSVKKAIANVVTVGTSVTGAVVLPSPWNVWVPAALGLAGAVVHYELRNGEPPVTADDTAWVANAEPPHSDAVMPTEHAE